MLDNLLDFSDIACTDEPNGMENVEEEIAIIGMSGCISGTKDYKEFWDALLNSKDCIIPYPENREKDVELFLDRTRRICKAGYMDSISEFDYEFFDMSYKEACFTEPNQRLFLQVVYHAIENAGYASESIKGSKTGVYVGQSSDLSVQYSDYINMATPERYSEISVPGNIKSIIAGRIAYYFDLQGPAVVIDTACSSALVAITSACDALKSGTIDMAIVGGVKIDIFPVQEGLDDEIGIRSSIDKLCAFDDSADGISSGEGVAAIILKRKENAIADGDHIHALVKGYALNNDGNSIGVTAPNPVAQEKVICNAWEKAGIAPENIDYIEAHGTGTNLGDPIEIEALTKAFGRYTQKKSFCAIGSVKTNVGHLDNIAGMASVFKAVEILKSGLIPASINFLRPNRKIDFIHSALYVNDNLCKLPQKGEPYLCGINGFGLAGTNCHIVLEQYKEDKVEKHTDSKVLFTISAKTEKQFVKLCEEYLEFFDAEKEIDLYNICYTALTGRFHMPVRRAFIVDSVVELKERIKEVIDELNQRQGAGNVRTKKLHGNQRKMQQLCMRYFETKNEEILYEISECYAEGAIPYAEMLFENGRKIEIPEYPYQKTRCWVDVQTKNALVDKCVVTTNQGTVYQTTYCNRTHWILNEHKVNGKYVLPGTAYIESLFQIMNFNKNHNALRIDNLFYISPLVLDEGEKRDVFTTIREDKEGYQFEIGSWKDGKWIQHAIGEIKRIEVGEKKYIKNEEYHDSEQLLQERSITVDIGKHWVDITKIIHKISNEEYKTYFEVPANYYIEATKSGVYAPALDRAMNVMNTIVGEGTYLPFSANYIEVYGEMPLQFYSNTTIKEVNDRTIKVDVSLSTKEGEVFCYIHDFIIKRIENTFLQLDKKELYHEITWEKAERDIQKASGSQIVVIMRKKDNDKFIWLKEYFSDAVFVFEGTEFSKQSENMYEIGKGEEDYKKLIEEMRRYHSIKILHALSLQHQSSSNVVEELAEKQNAGILSLFYLSKAVMENRTTEDTNIIVLSENTAIVTGGESTVNPENTALCMAVKVVEKEFPDIKCRYIDFDKNTSHEKVAKEIQNQDVLLDCAYRNNSRYVKKMKSVLLDSKKRNPIEVKKNGVYIITGGNGDLARAISTYFTSKEGQVILLGRSKEFEGQVPKNCKYMRCDITESEQLQQTLERVRKDEGPIHGIIHCAGIVDDKPIFLKKKEEVVSVLKPKVQGTWLLDHFTVEDNLDFLILFSSVSSIMVSSGQYDYVAANAYLDGFSAWRNLQGRRTIAINWAAWRETGMAYRLGIDEEKNSFCSLTTETAYNSFEEILRYNIQHIIVGEVNAKDKKDDRMVLMDNTFSKETSDDFKIASENDSVLLTETEMKVAKAWYEVLGNQNISIDDNFNSLGGDSIMAVRLLMRLNQFYQDLDITMIYSHPTIRQMAGYIEEMYRKHLTATEVVKETDDIDKLLEQLEKREVQVSEVISRI